MIRLSPLLTASLTDHSYTIVFSQENGSSGFGSCSYDSLRLSAADASDTITVLLAFFGQ